MIKNPFRKVYIIIILGGFISNALAESYCYINLMGKENCFELPSTSLAKPKPKNPPGGGGCGGSSACGHNNDELQWIPSYINNYPQRLLNSEKMIGAFEQSKMNQIQMLKSPIGISSSKR